MPGVTVSFVADPDLATRVKDIARSDGITQSQAAARALALGALIPPAARRVFRFIMDQGDEEAKRRLVELLVKAIAHVGDLTVERQLLARAPERPGMTEHELTALAVRAVADRRGRRPGLAMS